MTEFFLVVSSQYKITRLLSSTVILIRMIIFAQVMEVFNDKELD